MSGTQNKLCIGKIVGPHGIRGQVRVVSFTEEPAALFDYEPLTDETGGRVFEVTPRGVGKDHFLVSIKGVSDRNAAEALKGTELFVDRTALPEGEEGEYYFADLIGLEARDDSGVAYGQVTEVHDYGAGVFLEIKPAAAKSFMLPFTDAFVPDVDVSAGHIIVNVPQDWLSEAKEEKSSL